FIVLTIGSVTTTGALAPATSTAPTRRSARCTAWATLKLLEASVTIRPWKRSSTWRSRSRLMSRMETSAPIPTAVLAALIPTVPPDRLGLGLLHLEHERGVPPVRVHVREPRARPEIVHVADAAASARAGLDEHLVAPLAERPRPGGRQRDPLLAELDLARDADDHGRGRALRRPRMCCANSSPASSWRKWPASRITIIWPALGIS